MDDLKKILEQNYSLEIRNIEKRDLSDLETKRLKKLEKDTLKARIIWETMLDRKLKYGDKLIEREQPKKIEVENVIKPTDVGEMIRRAKEKIIDAEVVGPSVDEDYYDSGDLKVINERQT